MDINKIIETLIKEISSKFSDFEGLYFYGSRSLGESRYDSDYDMVFVFKNDYDTKKRRTLAEIIIDIEMENDIFIDHHPMTRKELERNPIFCHEVINKGRYYGAV